MLAIALGLVSSLSWGTSDFLGGLQARRISVPTVLAVSQPVGLALALGAALAVGEGSLGVREAALAAGAGASAMLALAAFYHAMALGSISVVATIGAFAVLVPVVGGLVQGEQPAAVQSAGIAVGIVGILLVAREPDPGWRRANRRSVGFAALAALGFGTFFLGIDGASDEAPAWAVVAARAGGVTGLAVVLAFTRPPLRFPRDMLPALLAIGALDVIANAAFALATNHGLLSLVSVAGSLYSAVTVLLARVVLAERLAASQWTGVPLAVTGVAMIAVGT